MTEQVFVVSDLHLGGEPDFQMCSAAGQALLASFTRWVTAQQQEGRDAHLVIAGDGVDFLSEAPSLAFTVEEGEATRKLGAIFERTRDVWDAFAAHVAAGGKFTLMLGNHDIELSLPRARRMLLERLGPGRVEVLYDDEALRIGGLLVEHGNRYDDWNWVDHDQLRHVRRNLSRGESADFFKPQPGSQFVIQVMNAIKRDYPFVDLLKPEDAAVPPFLAFLRPDLAQTMKDIGGSVREWIATKFRASDMGGDSTRDLMEDPVSARMAETDAMMALMDRVASDASAWEAHTTEGQRGSTGAFLSLLFGAKDVSRERAVQLDKLREVLRARVGSEGQGFNVDIESEQYLDAARNSVAHGAQVVVYGHTHLVKRVDLGGGALYLNTGTWADLMRVPTAVLREETPRDEALRELAEFADDLKDRARVSRWRRQVPTFARVKLGDDRAVRAADVHRYREGASLDAMKIPDGPLDF